MSEIHSLSGAYAVDALDELERAQFERHLAECQACRDEVASLREAAGMLAHATSASPPPSLRDRVLADITTVRPMPPQTSAVRRAPSRKKSSWSTRPGLLVAAAAAAIALGGTAVVTHPWSNDAPPPSAVAQVTHAPDAHRMTNTANGQPGASMTVVRSVSRRQAVLITEGMPAAPAGQTYQAWFREPDGQYVSAGLMSAPNGAPVLLDGDAATAVAAALTLEPAGGSDQPTEAPRAVVSFTKA